MHILFNGLVFYFFGPDLEELYGRRRFILFMVVCALVGNLVVVGAWGLGLSSSSSVVGFSGVTMGVTVAWGLTFPDREMLFFFFPMRGLTLVWVTLAMQVIVALSFSNTSAAAHFGGMAAGAAFSLTQGGAVRRWWLQRKLRRLQTARDGLRSARRASGPDLRVIRGGGDPPKDKRYLN
jgi:membrane associated rhomboid family serine protease